MTSIVPQSGVRDPARSRRVLIVDDHADSADVAAEVLRGCGHEIRVAYTAEAALSVAASFQPQVALLDISLPRMSGYELAALLRAQPSLAGCRFVAVTGSGHELERRKSEAAGFYCHLAKPFGVQALFDAVVGDPGAASCAPAAGWSVC